MEPKPRAQAAAGTNAVLLAVLLLVSVGAVTFWHRGVSAETAWRWRSTTAPRRCAGEAPAGSRGVPTCLKERGGCTELLEPRVRAGGSGAAKQRRGAASEELRDRRRTPPSRPPPFPQEFEAISKVQAWEFALPPDALARGVPLPGDSTQLRRVLRRALRGEPLSIFAAGGSVTWGMGATSPGEQGYVKQLAAFLNATLPPTGGRAHRVTNGGYSALTR